MDKILEERFDPTMSIMGQLQLMDERELAELLVTCKNTKFLKAPKGSTPEEKLRNAEKMQKEFENEVKQILQTYKKIGIIREIMEWATGFNYPNLEQYISHEFEILKRAGGFFKIKPRETETFIDFEGVIFKHWLKRMSQKIDEEIKKHPERINEMGERIKKDMPDDQKEELLKILQSVSKDKNLEVDSLDSIKNETLVKSILSLGLGGGSILFVNALGFSAYILLSQTIHFLATELIGITLSFSVYTTASSILAFLTGPWGWILIGTATLLTLGGSHKRKVKTAILANVFIPKVYLAYLSNLKNHHNK